MKRPSARTPNLHSNKLRRLSYQTKSRAYRMMYHHPMLTMRALLRVVSLFGVLLIPAWLAAQSQQAGSSLKSPPPGTEAEAKTNKEQPRVPQAKAQNTLGMRAHKDKDYVQSAKLFRAAIELDPSYVLAHYNLACAAAQLNQPAVAIAELSWLAKSTDPQAVILLRKAEADPDFDPLKQNQEVQKLLQWAGIFPGMTPLVLGRPATEAERGRFPLERKDGSLIEKSEKAIQIIEADFLPAPGKETILVSLVLGIVVLDAQGKVLATAAGLISDDLVLDGGDLRHIALAQITPDAEPELVLASVGDKAEGDSADPIYVTIYKRNGTDFKLIASAQITGASPSGFLQLAAIGTLLHHESGYENSMRREWDEKQSQFINTLLQNQPTAKLKSCADFAMFEDVLNFIGFSTTNSYVAVDTSGEIGFAGSSNARTSIYLTNYCPLVTGLPYMKSLTKKSIEESALTKLEQIHYSLFDKQTSQAREQITKKGFSRCIPGRLSPDGTTEVVLEVKSRLPTLYQRWKGKTFLFGTRDASPASAVVEPVKLQMVIKRAGKVLRSAEYVTEDPFSSTRADAYTCWSPSGQHVAVVISRDPYSRRDPGERRLFLLGVPPADAAPSTR